MQSGRGLHCLELSWCPQLILFLTCNKPSSMANARYIMSPGTWSFKASQNFMHASLVISLLALSYIFWYVLFHDYSAFSSCKHPQCAHTHQQWLVRTYSGSWEYIGMTAAPFCMWMVACLICACTIPSIWAYTIPWYDFSKKAFVFFNLYLGIFLIPCLLSYHGVLLSHWNLQLRMSSAMPNICGNSLNSSSIFSLEYIASRCYPKW